MIARLSRILPLLAVLAIVAGIVYLVVAWRYSPNKGKEILIRLFTIVMGVFSGFFGLVTLYAWFEHNDPAFDLAVSFLLAGLVGLGITRICRAVFVRNHPNWRKRPFKTRFDDRGKKRPPWRR